MSEVTVDVVIIGQGLAGSALAWRLHWLGRSIAIVDRQENITASKVAAGLITPVTGKRMVMMEDYLTYWTTARDFYQRVEEQTKTKFFFPVTMVRRFRNREELEVFQQRRQKEYVGIVELKQEAGKPIGFTMQPAARLKVPTYLSATWQYFERYAEIRAATVKLPDDLKVTKEGVELPRLALRCEKLVFAQGYEKSRPEWFSEVPNKPARGEILTVRLPNRKETEITHQGIWIVPEGNQLFRVGATYDTQNLSHQPSESGKEQLLGQLSEEENETAEVIEHVAALRPAMRDRKVVATIHQTERRVAIMNGMGAKGSLVAPYKADVLAKEISRELGNQQSSQEEETLTSSRLKIIFTENSVASSRQSLTRLVHEVLSEHLHDGDRVIDATAGNGYDTKFLAEHVGGTGKVWAFDVQPSAIVATGERLRSVGIVNVDLILASHEDLEMTGLPEGSVSAITFNLGYLPGGDKNVITRTESTVIAVNKSLSLLKENGLLSIIAYRGHEGGTAEAAAVAEQIKKVDGEKFRWIRIAADTGNARSPELWLIQKQAKVKLFQTAETGK